MISNRSTALLRAVIFVVAFVAMQLSWESLRGTPVEFSLIHDLTVRPAAWLVNLFTPQVNAQAVQFTLRAPGGGLNILNGCEGTEALFLLLSAFLVAPLTLRWRLTGVLLGVAVVFGLNQARILILFYAYRANHAWFDPLHGTVTPIALVLLISAYFYVWLYLGTRPSQGMLANTHA